MKVVISLGGSLLYPPDDKYLEKFAGFIKNHKHEFYVVTGGGRIARDYIKMARKFGADERYLDKIGIIFTRANAMLLNSFFGGKIPHTIEMASKMKPPVIMGGTSPGHSTDAVAAMLASKIKADLLIIATDVDGVYDRDPKKYPYAKLIRKIPVKKLQAMAGGGRWKKAGANVVIDGIACKIIGRMHIRSVILNGRYFDRLENAIYGKSFKGTEIVFE